jgi:putative DNA primase/helicase
LQPLLDKALAIIPDARLRGQTDIVVERLLSISGEDLLTVNRKNKDPIAVKLATRIVLVTNELPRLDDASGALVNRMIILRFTRTFLGRENPNLTGQLLEELPGILLWAIAGWRSLTQRGSFVQPESANQLLCELQELSSPIMGFIHDCCHVGPHHTVERKALYEAYKAWCAESGRHSPVTRESFGRDLRAAVPGLTDTQPSSNGQRSRYYQGISLRSN